MLLDEVVGIIPVRYASTRFPGKPLAVIQGKTLIQHTYENAKKCPLLKKLVIATDDKRIYDHAKSFGARCVMTPEDCPNGTIRVAKAIEDNKELADADLVVNIQGDEPCINVDAISKVIKSLKKDDEAVISTAVVPCTSYDQVLDPSIVKCVFDQKGYALYFSRSPIPHTHNKSFSNCYLHLGLYCYRKGFLMHYPDLFPTPLQEEESLEQLRVLEYGYRIKVSIAKDWPLGVDTPEDIQKVEKFLCN